MKIDYLNAEEVLRYTVWKEDNLIMENVMAIEIREYIEQLPLFPNDEDSDFFIMFQEGCDEYTYEFQLWVHSDTFDELSEEQLTILEELGFTRNEEDTDIILNYYGLKVVFSHIEEE
ncbi:hypothetical protein SAMN05880501_101144 [Ureibacillus xyleni]|uniref:Uncharacterized protein n=1 Tax=Ureibacillus xyleni TaxID=614648 RepID=A0A285R9A0_9BACL|nr:hypothetical protein [Ureibacillus xyleni]SOB90338.1 hypothetical protein SAMN05880501_101144 [Ureibacillus xyleni]